MNNTTATTTIVSKANNRFRIELLLFILFVCSPYVFSQSKIESTNKDSKLIDEYVQSKKQPIIVFDSNNIKQFWIDNSVYSSSQTINISLSGGKSEQFKIHLINVNESQDCTVEMLMEDKEASFSILDGNNRTIAKSTDDVPFLEYFVKKSTFHLENIKDGTFFLFFSSSSQTIRIKRIILSFDRNEDSAFFASPGKISLSKDSFTAVRSEIIDGEKTNQFIVKGILSLILSNQKIISANNDTFHVSAKVKNVGNNDTNVMIGFGAYNNNGTWINNNHYPYNNINKVLKVISAKKGDTKLMVDSYPEWKKEARIALNAKEDLSDVPNTSLLNETVLEVKETDENHAEITLNSPLSMDLEEGTLIRINSSGSGYLPIMSKVLKAGEETLFDVEISKDDQFLQYSPEAISHGVYYLRAVLMSYSVDQTLENTLLVEDYTVTF